MQSEPSPDRPVALIGAPFDLGSGGKGSAAGPSALRDAGLADTLRRRGLRVIDRGDARGVINTPWSEISTARPKR